MIRQKHSLLILFALFLGAFLRVWHLGGQSLWMDEAWSVWLSSHAPMQILKILETDAHPPLFYLILHTWMAIGRSEAILRFPFALLGAFNGLLIYWVGRRTVGLQAALLAALFWEISFAAIFSETQVRMYSLVIFLSLAASLALLRGLEKPSGLRWLSYFVLSLSAIYTHYGAVWIVLGHLIYLAAIRRWRILSLLTAGFLAAGLPWAPVFLDQISIRLSPRPGLGVRELLTFSGFLGAYDVLADSPANWILNFLAIGLVAIGALRARKDSGRLVTLIFVVSFAAPVLFTAFTPLRIYLFRSAIVFAPYFFLLFFFGMAQVSKRLFLPLLGFLILMNLGMWFLFSNGNNADRQDWRPAVQFLNASLQPGDTVVVEHFMSVFPIGYYAPGRFEITYSNYKFKITNRSWIPVDSRTSDENLAQISADSKRVWLVLCDDWIADPSGKISSWFFNHRKLASQTEFPSLDPKERIEVMLTTRADGWQRSGRP